MMVVPSAKDRAVVLVADLAQLGMTRFVEIFGQRALAAISPDPPPDPKDEKLKV